MGTSRYSDSGLDVASGNHLCLLYGGDAEYGALLAADLRRGLSRGERVLCLVELPPPEELPRVLADAGFDPRPFLASGRLRILSLTKSWLPGGSFDPDRAAGWLRKEVASALAEGIPAVHLAAEMSSAMDDETECERLARYETLLNEMTHRGNLSVLCCFDRRRLTPRGLRTVMAGHPDVAAGHRILGNPFYVPPEALRDGESADRLATRWLEGLTRCDDAAAVPRPSLPGHARRPDREPYRLIFQSCPAGIFQYDLYLRITDCNDRFCESLRTRRSALLGVELGKVKDKAILPALRAALLGAEGRYEGRYRATYSAADLYISLRTAPLCGEDGKCEGGIGFVEDISARVEAEAELRKYAVLVEHSDDLIAMAALDGRLLFMNRAGRELLGLEDVEEIRTIDVRDFSFAKQGPGLEGVLSGLRCAGSWKGETKIRHFRTGASIPAEMHAFAIKDPKSGEIVALAGIGRDISERKSVEREMIKAQKLESIGVLAGGIAHDFNNLLSAIAGYVSLARAGVPPGGEVGSHLAEAEKTTFRARDLTQRLLTFSKGGTPVKRAVALGGLLRESAALALRGSNVRCDITLPPDLWPVEVDEGQIIQVLNNLLINARQAMPNGGALRVSARNVLSGRDELHTLAAAKYVKLSIADTGVGIPAEHLEKIFDPYFTTKRQGSGLGLATSYAILRKHRGGITVRSAVGEGSTFSLFLPAPRDGGVGRERLTGKPMEGKGRILVMDDEEALRNVAAAMLRSLGYTATTAKDGAEALALYGEARNAGEPYDAVIMDLTVSGGMGGQEATEKLLATAPEAKVIVSSGYSNSGIMSDFRAYGFSAMVPKPYNLRQLGKAVGSLLAGASPAAARRPS